MVSRHFDTAARGPAGTATGRLAPRPAKLREICHAKGAMRDWTTKRVPLTVGLSPATALQPEALAPHGLIAIDYTLGMLAHI